MPKIAELQLDHSWYRYLLPYAVTRQEAAAKLWHKKYSKVIDLGSADCSFLLKQRHLFDAATGIDITKNIFSRQQKNFLKLASVNFIQGDLNRKTAFSPASTDLVISLCTIEYLNSPEIFLKEVYRLLKPKGHLIIHTMNMAFILRRLQLLAGGLPTFNSAPGWQGGILHNFTWPTARMLLNRSGFKILEENCSGLLPEYRLWNRNLLSSDMIFLCQKEK